MEILLFFWDFTWKSRNNEEENNFFQLNVVDVSWRWNFQNFVFFDFVFIN